MFGILPHNSLCGSSLTPRWSNRHSTSPVSNSILREHHFTNHIDLSRFKMEATTRLLICVFTISIGGAVVGIDLGQSGENLRPSCERKLRPLKVWLLRLWYNLLSTLTCSHLEQKEWAVSKVPLSPLDQQEMPSEVSSTDSSSRSSVEERHFSFLRSSQLWDQYFKQLPMVWHWW